MPPPPKPPQGGFAPALAIKRPAKDTYDPHAVSTEKSSFVKNALDDEPLRGTLTTIDAETGVRNWDQHRRIGTSTRISERVDTTSNSRRGSTRSGNVWDSWAESSTSKSADRSRHERSPSSMSLTSNADFEDEIRGRFVGMSTLMNENQRSLTDFERRNHSVLYQGNMERLKNIVGDKIVSVTHQPVDERLQYLDENGKYRDGIDRGAIKKRLMEEWHKRLADRSAEMEHVTKLKREWDALPDSEKRRGLVQRAANTLLLSVLGAGLDSTNDTITYEGENLPEIYRRVDKRTFSEPVSVSDGARKPDATCSVNKGARPQLQRRGHYFPTEHTLPITVRDTLVESTGGSSSSAVFEGDILGFHSPSPDRASTVQGLFIPSTERYGSTPSSVESRMQNHESRREDRYNPQREPWEPQGPRARPLTGKRKRPVRPPSTVATRIPTPPSRPFLSPVTPRPRIKPSVHASPKPASSATSETTVAFDHVPDLAVLADLPERTDIEDRWGAGARFDKIKDASTKHGRVVMVRLHEPVHFSSSAISERLFGGAIQEIQYHPAERMALVVFLFPSDANAMVQHVKTIRENNAHEYRRLQIDVDWYQSLEIKAVYPAQVFTLATMLTEQASRIILVTHVPVLKKMQDFAQDMKTAFPDKILVKAAISKPIQRYVQKRDGNKGILEFTRIIDAFEVMKVFENRGVLGYERSTVEWLNDSCDVIRPALPFCDCLMCKGRVMKLVKRF
ncbi:hypothetical protein MMC26_001502 [Xylographa opegraphella]|nr:hypothetical protein [Xylographa opegraphella]